jgi:transposase
VAACDGGDTRAEAADRFGVSERTVYNLLRLRARTGGVAPRPRPRGFPSKVDAAARAKLRGLVAARPDATLAELCAGLAAGGGPAVKPPRMCQVLAALRLPRKKRS